ncbi:MAG: helix-turn-helix domain-containing protein [Lachnospiraceae bacterium]
MLEKLSLYEGNVSMVARKMGISRKTLYKKLNKYGIKTK